MNNWTETPFLELLVDSKDGEWGESEEAVGLREAIIIRGTDFADLDDPGSDLPKRWVKDHIAERKQLRPGDLILETAGGTSSQSTGRSALLKEALFLRNPNLPVLCASFSRHLRLATGRYSPRFIYYLLRTLYCRGYMAVFNIQHTGVSRFQFTAFKKHTKLRIPGLPIQRRVAAIASAYDDLISNNKQRIVLLERLAEEIYREWFVRFRYPAHHDAELQKGLPSNWDTKRVKEIVVRKRFGRIYREDELSIDGQVVVIDQSRKELLGFYDGEPQHMASPEKPFILFGDHTCKMVFMTKPFSLAENVVPFEPKPGISPYFLFHLLKGLATTTEYKRHWTELTNREVLVPEGSLQIAFDEAVRDSHAQIELLRVATRRIEVARDLLVPRLVSGKLSVENIDVQFPPGMNEELNADQIVAANA